MASAAAFEPSATGLGSTLTPLQNLQRRRRRDDSSKAPLFREEDDKSVMQKLTDAAVRYDKNHPSAMSLAAFEGAKMEPHIFSEQLKRVFHIRLTKRELAAAMSRFDLDGDGTVACNEFLLIFKLIGFEERHRIFRERRERVKRRAVQAARLAEIEKAEADRKNDLQIDASFSEADDNEAMSKITKAAIRYDKHHPASVGLDAFEGAEMPPHVFREQLKRVFNVRMTPKEMGAVMKHFDIDGNGNIACHEFLLRFFRKGFEERNRIRQTLRREKAAREEAAERLREQQQAEAQQREAALVAPYRPSDVETTLEMLVQAAARYDRRALGPAGLKAWEVFSMNPAQLRESMGKTFGLRPSPQQLSVILDLFDLDKSEQEADAEAEPPFTSGSVEIPEFLNAFFRIGVVAKGLLGYNDTEQRLAKLKDRIKLQVAPEGKVTGSLKNFREHPTKRPQTVPGDSTTIGRGSRDAGGGAAGGR
ncbi:unnamed protein product, partial [Phaeothamnion confervicola]